MAQLFQPLWELRHTAKGELLRYGENRQENTLPAKTRDGLSLKHTVVNYALHTNNVGYLKKENVKLNESVYRLSTSKVKVKGSLQHSESTTLLFSAGVTSAGLIVENS